MPRNIAIFSTSWNASYLYEYLQGVKECALSQNVNIHLFNTYGDSEEYTNFNKYEYRIFDLPDLSNFEGAIIISNNVGSTEWVKKLVTRIKEANIPCLGVEQEMKGFHYMGVDNYSATYDMVTYLVEKKHCKSLYYIGGPHDNIENKERKRAFLDVLKSHQLSCPIEGIKEYSFRIDDGEKAYHDFQNDGLPIPDAVVCANDNMAIGFLQAAALEGHEAPRDFLITGFDHIQESYDFAPTITTIDRSVKHLGSMSLSQLLDMIDGAIFADISYVPYTMVLAESTEATIPKPDITKFKRESFYTQMEAISYRADLDRLNMHFLEKQTIDNCMRQMNCFLPKYGINSYAFCLNKTLFSKGESQSSEECFLLGNKNGSTLFQDHFNPQNLIPREFHDSRKSHIYLYSPCHCGDVEHGYFVIMDHLEIVAGKRLYHFLLTANSILESLRQNILLQEMNTKLHDLYRKDSMTGLYNRFALLEMGEPLLLDNRKNNQDTLLLFADMDSLKKANDLYGHGIGDLALITIAKVLLANCADSSYFGVRYGGDEFLLLGNYYGKEATDNLVAKIHSDLLSASKEANLPFDISISIGYSSISANTLAPLETYIKEADTEMYERKRRKKQLNQ